MKSMFESNLKKYSQVLPKGKLFYFCKQCGVNGSLPCFVYQNGKTAVKKIHVDTLEKKCSCCLESAFESIRIANISNRRGDQSSRC